MKVLRIFHRDNKEFEARFCVEAILWQSLNHKNVLPFYGICENVFQPLSAMVSPWMENGDLVGYLKRNNPPERRSLTLGVALGLQYLHGLKPPMVHGDLRASNVLVDEHRQPRIADFGLAKVIDAQASSLLPTSFNGRGNTRWQAPELLNASRFEGVKPGVTKESDVYAFAHVCWEVFTGSIPFPDLVDGAVILAVAVYDRRPGRPSEPATKRGLDDNVWKLMMTCWAAQPRRRLSMNGVVKFLTSGKLIRRVRVGRAAMQDSQHILSDWTESVAGRSLDELSDGAEEFKLV
ncbi:kinase-like protein [Rickenella mellea]|uniref:Kinase-like protein n=1 Tax=Rickenella mellea TaxID=50990 RepID=A0A4Y7Q4D2_9AGAM|nr:kinase-like protein [Rickenella mellea]